MLKIMGTSSRIVFNDFISDCLTQENNNNAYAASKSCKRAFELGPSQSRALVGGRSQYHPPTPGARFRPPQRRNQNTQPRQKNQKAFKVAVPQAKARHGSSAEAGAPKRGPLKGLDS
jgi:hypothetical protein